MSLADRHVAFLGALREAGLPVSLAEGLDAARALSAVTLTDREALRVCYATTLVKRHGHRAAFDALFDLWFPRAVGEATDTRPDERPSVEVTGGRDAPEQVGELRADLAAALFTGDDAAMRGVAMMAVGRLGKLGAGSSGGTRSWSSSAVLERLSARTLMAGLLRTELGDDRGGVAERSARTRFGNRIAAFESMVSSEVFRRIAEDKGAEVAAKNAVRPPLERIGFLSATKADLDAMRREIYPLAQRLATRLTNDHRQGRRGVLDFRRTIRGSLSYGGVPIEVHRKPRRPHKTELVILCDTSTSVAPFARFALLLIYALREQFTRVRAFSFVDSVEEITDVFAPGEDVADALARLDERADRPWIRGGTNYGRAFEQFEREFPDALGPRACLLVLGDGRANHLDPGLENLRRMTSRCRRGHWLNPEPRMSWGTGDSEAPAYGGVMTMHECRDLHQLSEFVRELAG